MRTHLVITIGLLPVIIVCFVGKHLAPNQNAGGPARILPNPTVSGNAVLNVGHATEIIAARFVGRDLCTISRDGQIQFRESRTGQLRGSATAAAPVGIGARIISDTRFVSEMMAFSGSDANPKISSGLQLCNLQTGAVIANLANLRDVLPPPVAAATGASEILLADGNQIRVFDAQDGRAKRTMTARWLNVIHSLQPTDGGIEALVVGDIVHQSTHSSRLGNFEMACGLMDLHTGRVVRLLNSGPNHLEIKYLAVSRNGGAAAAIGDGGYGAHYLLTWNLKSGAIRSTRNLGGRFEPVAIALVATGETVAVVGKEFRDADRARLLVCRTADGAVLHSVPLDFSRPTTAAISTDLALIASGEYDGAVRVCSATTGKTLNVTQAWGYKCTSPVFSPDGTLLAITGSDGALRLWHTRSGSLKGTRTGGHGTLSSAVFSADSKTIWAGAVDGGVLQWQVPGGAVPVKLPSLDDADADGGYGLLDSGPDYIWRLAYSPQQQLLAGARYEERLNMWHTSSGTSVPLPANQIRNVSATVFSPRGDELIVGGYELAGDSVSAWDTQSNHRLWSTSGELRNVWALACSPDGSLVAAGGERHWLDEGIVALLDSQSGTILHTLIGHRNRVREVVFSPDGRQLASVDLAGVVQIWDAAPGSPERAIQLTSGAVTRLIFSPDSRLLVAASGRELTFWDAAAGNLQLTLDILPPLSPERPAASRRAVSEHWIAFSPGGDYDGSAGSDRSLLWKVNGALRWSARLAAQYHRPGLLAQVLRL